MPLNLLEQLGEQRIPAPPVKLHTEVRQRMNNTLLTTHVLDFALRGVPFALWHFAQAVGGLLALTLTGTYEPHVREDARRD
jgi:hypothetical protein